jgi:hypothetical protein
MDSIPALLADPAGRKAEASELVCDSAAGKLHELVVGLPTYHPLLKDTGARSQAMKRYLDLFHGRFRRTSAAEVGALGLDFSDATFIPDLKPLGQVATPDDVSAGRAIFHLAGKGKPAAIQLPATALFDRTAKEHHSITVLIVQAEVGQTGETIYGVIARDFIRSLTAKSLRKITPLENKKGNSPEKDR